MEIQIGHTECKVRLRYQEEESLCTAEIGNGSQARVQDWTPWDSSGLVAELSRGRCTEEDEQRDTGPVPGESRAKDNDMGPLISTLLRHTGRTLSPQTVVMINPDSF